MVNFKSWIRRPFENKKIKFRRIVVSEGRDTIFKRQLIENSITVTFVIEKQQKTPRFYQWPDQTEIKHCKSRAWIFIKGNINVRSRVTDEEHFREQGWAFETKVGNNFSVKE